MCVCENNRTVHVQQAAGTDWSLLISHLAGHAPRIEGHLMWSWSVSQSQTARKPSNGDWALSCFFKTSISVHFPISTNHPLGWPNRVLDIWSKSTWPADGQVIKSHPKMWWSNRVPCLRMNSSQDWESEYLRMLDLHFLALFSTYHLMQCTRSTSDSERKKTCNTFVADSSCALAILLLHNCLERVIDLHSHVMFTIRSRDMLQKHAKARKNNPASEPICKAWLQKYQ